MQLSHITSIAVYDDSPSFAYTVVRIESSGRIAENLKLRRETNNNCVILQLESFKYQLAMLKHVYQPIPQECFGQMLLKSNQFRLCLTNISMKRERNLTSFCGEMMDMRCSFEMLVNWQLLVWVQDNVT